MNLPIVKGYDDLFLTFGGAALLLCTENMQNAHCKLVLQLKMLERLKLVECG